jgi:16S rRNA (cytidine1402-2'-O)-methyltransferase
MSGPALSQAASTGRLILMPNTLDLGNEPAPIQDVLPLAVLQHAATLQHWVAEDARSTRAFLKRVDAVVPLAQPLQSLQITELPRARKGSREAVPAAEWQALLQPALNGQDLGLISEAGLPGVADPGALLVAAAHDAGLQVLPLAGPSSLLLALAASGLNGQSFAFVGYLPQEPAARSQRIKELDALSRRQAQTQICIETPYRNAALLAGLLEALSPTTRLSVSVGLTLAGGYTRSATVAAWRRDRLNLSSGLPDKLPAVFCWLAL